MIGTVGEYIIESTSSTTEIVADIKAYEKTLGLNTLPSDFVIKKIGIKPSDSCTVTINGRPIVVDKNDTIEFDYGIIDISSLYISDGVKVAIRDLY